MIAVNSIYHPRKKSIYDRRMSLAMTFLAWQLKQLELSFKIQGSSGTGFIIAQQAAQLLYQQVVQDLNIHTLLDILHQLNTTQSMDFITLMYLLE